MSLVCPYMDLFWLWLLVVFKVIWGSFGALVSKWPVKTAARKAKLSESWDSRCSMYMGYLLPFSDQSHFGVILCTCLNWLDVRRERSEICD